MVMLGDSFCRRFYSFVSLPHRFAAAFLSGLVISSWFTYLGALLFMGASQPMLWGNLLFFAAAVGLIFWLRRLTPNEETRPAIGTETTGANKWDWIVIGIIFVFVCVLEFGTFSMSAGKVRIANHQWSDFGSTVSIMQSFAIGRNFPTELPHFSGERIHYHFLYYFQAGNLEYLGFNPAFSNNILSALSLVSMLVLVMTLGVVIFRSRAVGRIAAAIFFFHGSLSYISFIRSQASFSELVNSVSTIRDFLPSGFPYHGETWGVWSQVVFLNQRHLASSIGIFLLVLVFILIRYRDALSLDNDSKLSIDNESNGAEPNEVFDEPATFVAEPNQTLDESAVSVAEPDNLPAENLPDSTLKSFAFAPFVFSGVLLGLLPMWNSPVFIAAFGVLGILFLLFPLKKQMLAMAVVTAVVALPQIIFLKTGKMEPVGYSIFHWGYTIDEPTIINVVKYLGFTFGFKWLLIAVALVLATKFQRRVFVAVTSLIALAFCFRFSMELLANHKLLNVWLVLANLFAAYGLFRLWKMRFLKTALPGKIAAVILVVLISIGGIIDFFPIYNSYWIVMPFEDDSLVRWVSEETDPKAVFVTSRHVNHPILLAGRRLFYGYPYYAQSAGYPVGERGDRVYKRMFEERNPQRLLRLLKENNVSYVAFDNGVRKDDFLRNPNETVYKSNFEKVFQDLDKRYDELIIFKVPADLSEVPPSVLEKPTIVEADAGAYNVNAFEGGLGIDYGQFDKPRGIAADAAGNVYVADLGNARIQKFSSEGKFLAAYGSHGTGDNELLEPNGITVDSVGNIYIADANKHRLIKYKADGNFEKQWSGPSPGFYGPRDVAVGSNKQLYILDQGRNRVVKFDPDPESEIFTEWGQNGTNEGEFSDPTGLAVANDRVFVADAGNNRIQVFDLDGKFIRQLAVPEWNKNLGHFPDVAFDVQADRLYATSGVTNEVLVFDADGNRLESLKPDAPAKLDNPSALVLADTVNGRRLYVLNTGGNRVTEIKLSKPTKQK
jgi:DNA-binding beta-propeller fold protein YncE